MEFDIFALEKQDLEYGSDEAERAFNEYEDDAIDAFMESRECEALRDSIQDEVGKENIGGWVHYMLHYGYFNVGVTPPDMQLRDAREIMEDLLPRKVSLTEPKDANNAIPELRAFWQFLQRVYDLPRCPQILAYLQELEPTYYDIMNDESRFGMAKSFVMAGLNAGYDMSNPAELRKFQEEWNKNLAPRLNGPPLLGSLFGGENFLLPERDLRKNIHADKDKKKKRKAAKQARRKARRK